MIRHIRGPALVCVSVAAIALPLAAADRGPGGSGGGGIPGYTIWDSGNPPKRLGPVVSISGTHPIVRFRDDQGQLFEAFVNRDGIFFPGVGVYFSGDDCEGVVYLKAPTETSGFPSLRGRAYGIVRFGNPSAGDIFIYRTDAADGVLTPVESRFNGIDCLDWNTQEVIVTGTAVMNLTAKHPPPYTAN